MQNVDKSPYTLLSFPRSGSHYLQNLLFARLGITAHNYHWMNDIKNSDVFIIAVVRNPIDSIASTISNSTSPIDAPGLVESHVNTFIKSMDEIMSNADIIIDFKELISNADSIAKKISETLGHRLFDNGHDISVLQRPDSSFIPSSKILPEYDHAKQLVSNDASITKAINKYSEVIAKTI